MYLTENGRGRENRDVISETVCTRLKRGGDLIGQNTLTRRVSEEKKKKKKHVPWAHGRRDS